MDSLMRKRIYRIVSFVANERPRFIFAHMDTFEPSVAISYYEQWLTTKHSSYKSVKDILDKLVYFYTWAEYKQFNVEQMLLEGLAPQPAIVRDFANWLHVVGVVSSEGGTTKGITLYNKILDATANVFCYFVEQFGVFDGVGNLHAIDRELVASGTLKSFRKPKKKNPKLAIADDLSEEEIGAIEHFLKPSNRTNVNFAVATRDYLIWRLAIEFGLREGEILALRLEDCPHRDQHYVKVVRIEERGKDYHDPRGVYQPRPKTLSRDIGFIVDNSPFIKTLQNYISKYRYRPVLRNGNKVLEPVLDHKFLIINYSRRNPGAPLGPFGMQDLAELISKETGIKFHWHLARHAFFNRIYAAVADHPELKTRLLDIVYLGGWESEKSLQIYINRARRERARVALDIWQQGGNTWAALQ